MRNSNIQALRRHVEDWFCRLTICILVEFVKPEANPNNNLMMRRAGLSNLPGIVLWFLFAYLVDSGCSWHFDLLWACSLNSIYQSQIVVSLVRNLQKKCPTLRWTKVFKSSLKAVLSLIWSARELAEANSIEIKHQHAAIDCLGKHKTWNHLRWQYIWNIDRGKSGPRNVFPKSSLFPYDRLLLSLGDDLLKKKDYSILYFHHIHPAI